MIDMLKKELDTYVKQKSKLIGKFKGKFVLIKGNKIFNVFDTKIDAIRQGYVCFVWYIWSINNLSIFFFHSLIISLRLSEHILHGLSGN